MITRHGKNFEIQKPNRKNIKDLEKQFKQELKNNSKSSVIKEQLKKNIGKIVNVIITNKDSIEVNMYGKLRKDIMISNKFWLYNQSVDESNNLDYVTFKLKDIESINNRDNKTIRIYLK